MGLGGGRFVGQTRDLRSTSSQRGLPGAAVSGVSGTAFTPMQLGGLVGWWDASDTSTITSSAGAVSQWDDKSGRGNHLVQATAANQPATGSATQNGLNIIRFDGTNDRLIRNPFSLDTYACTIAFVARENADNGGGFVVPYSIGANDYSDPGCLTINASTNSSLHMESANAGVIGASISGTGATPLGAYALVKTGPWAAFFRNNTQWLNSGAATHSTTPGNSLQLLVGVRWVTETYTNHLNGDMMEIVAVGRPIMPGELSALMRYLTIKWGI